MQPTDRFEVLGIWEESKFSPNARAAMPEIGPLLETYDNSKVADDVRLPELPKGRAFHELCFEGVPTDISIGPEQTLAAQFSVEGFFLVLAEITCRDIFGSQYIGIICAKTIAKRGILWKPSAIK